MQTDIPAAPCFTAFAGQRKVAAGPLHGVAQSLKELVTRDPAAQILIFDDASGRQVDLNLHGSLDEGAAAPAPARPAPAVPARGITDCP